MNQKEVMLLGGNLPESFSQYLHLGNRQEWEETGAGDDVAYDSKDQVPEEERVKTGGNPRKEAATI
jgi:hypothetical protein